MIDINLIKEPISEKLKELSYELYSLRTYVDKKTNILEIVVDRDSSIDLDDIVEVSNNISTLLDELIKDDTPYTLDISSLGAEKPIKLESLDKYVGQYVNVHLSNPYKGENTLEGDLVEIDSDKVVIQFKIKTRLVKAEILRKDIDRARLAIKF